MNVAIRVDASPVLGIGHVMRCLSLADSLKTIENIKIEFVCCEELPQSLGDRILSEGFNLYLLEGNQDLFKESQKFLDMFKTKKLDWVVVDHYGIDETWESEIRPITKGIIVIDDLANRKHLCDILIDQNLYSDMQDRYRSLVPNYCRQYLGPEFSLIRKEFFEFRDNVQARDWCKNVLVSFGGSDPTEEISKVLTALEMFPEILNDLFFHIVAGPANVKRAELQQRSGNLPNVKFYDQIYNMTELLATVDLAIGAGGISLWERCFMGVPSIVIIVADNQREVIEVAEKKKLIWNMGLSKEVSPKMIAYTLKSIIDNPSPVKELSSNSLEFMSRLRNRPSHPIIADVRNMETYRL